MPRRILFATLLVCIATVARAEIRELEGAIKSVDADKREITIGKKTLDIAKKAEITIDGKQATVNDLKAGQDVVVEYDDELEVVRAVTVGATALDGDAMAAAMKELQGTWIAIGMETNGEALAKAEVRRQHRLVVIKGNSYTEEFAREGKVLKTVGKFEINPRTNTFDFIGKGPMGAVLEYIGLYELKDGKLRLCLRANVDGNARRPKIMESAAQDKNWTLLNVYERDEDETPSRSNSK